jgi:hypothetical protein
VRLVIGPETNSLPENEALYDLWIGGGLVPVQPGTAAAKVRFEHLIHDLCASKSVVLSNTPRFWSYVGGRGGVVCRRLHIRYE